MKKLLSHCRETDWGVRRYVPIVFQEGMGVEAPTHRYCNGGSDGYSSCFAAQLLRLSGGVALVPFVSACGGSGGGNSAVAPSFNVQTAQSASPFSTLNVEVPTIQAGDTYTVSWQGISKAITPWITGANTLAIPTPPFSTTSSMSNGGTLALTVQRSRGGVAASAAQGITIYRLQPSPFPAGAMIRICGGLQDALKSGAAPILLPKTSTNYLANSRLLFGSSGLGTVKLTPTELNTLEACLYAALTQAGIGLGGVPQNSVRLAAAVAKQAFSPNGVDSFGQAIIGIGQNLGADARAAGSVLQKVGGTIAVAGAIFDIVPLAVVGSVAVMIGLGFGLAEGLIMDNAAQFGSLDSDTKVQWKDSVQYFASYIGSALLDTAVDTYTALTGRWSKTRLRAS